MTSLQAISSALRKSFNFSGRAPRAEFWWFFFYIIAIIFVIGILSVTTNVVAFGLLTDIWLIVVALPTISVSIRRLHDINLSGWHYLWTLFPAVFGSILYLFNDFLPETVFIILAMGCDFIIILLFFMWFTTKGDQDENRFGPDPYTEQSPNETEESIKAT